MHSKNWEIRITEDAGKFLDKLRDKKTVERLRNAILSLATNPHPAGHKKLTGAPGFRIRVGDYRIIYAVDNGRVIVTVIRIGHRGDVYRKN